MIFGASGVSKTASLVNSTARLRSTQVVVEVARKMPNASALCSAVRVSAGRPVKGLRLGAASSWRIPRLVLTLLSVRMLLTCGWPFGSH